MRRFFTGLAAIGLCAALSAALPARAQSPTSIDVTQVISANYPDVIAAVSVHDATGAPVSGLATANFAASDDSGPVPVIGAQAAVNADVGLAVVLVMDTSGSMEGEPLALTEEAAIRFVDSLLPKDGAIVISFASGVSPPSPLTADKQALAATLRGLQAGGGTALYDTVVAGAQAAKAAPLPRKVVVLLTDGQDSGDISTVGEEQSLSQAAASGVPFFAIGVGEDINVPYLQDLATRSGGQFLAAPAPADIPAVYDRIGIMLRSQYLVRLRLAAPADGGTSDLKLTVTAGGASASGSARFARPGTPSTPTPTPKPTPEATASTGDGGGPSLLLFALAGGIGVLLVGGGVIGTRRIRRRRVLATASGPTRAARSYTPPPVATWRGPAAPSGRLTVIEGPDRGKSVSLGENTVTLGSDADCTLSLADPDGRVAGHHVRIWLREGHFMLHHLAGGRYSTVVGENSLKWAVLEDGDEIVIGPHRLRFEAASSS
jgi:VWFA-related protein